MALVPVCVAPKVGEEDKVGGVGTKYFDDVMLPVTVVAAVAAL